jgi:group I intron endonuclease
MNNIVYKVTNLINGRVYIGQTYKTLEKRNQEHFSDALYDFSKGITNQPFHLALMKYGEKFFHWEILKENLSIEEANTLETSFIKEFDSFNNGYNATTGGKKYWRHSDETKQLIAKKASILSKKMWEDPAHLENMSIKIKTSWQDESIRKHRSETIKTARSTEKQRFLSSEDSTQRYANPQKREEMAIACGAKKFDVFKDGVFIGSWVNAVQCTKDLGLKSKGHISNCLHGRSKKYCGYEFRYSEIIDTQPVVIIGVNNEA